MFLRNRPAFHSKEKSRGYSVYSYSRIGSIKRALKFIRRWAREALQRSCQVSLVAAAQVSGLVMPVKPVYRAHESYFWQCKGQNRAFSTKINVASGVRLRFSLRLKLSPSNALRTLNKELTRFLWSTFFLVELRKDLLAGCQLSRVHWWFGQAVTRLDLSSL